MGIDKIGSEMLVGMGEVLWRILTALFNVFLAGRVCNCSFWLDGGHTDPIA